MATSTIKQSALGPWTETGTQGVTVRRGNGIIQVKFNIAISIGTAFTNIATLPEGYRPSSVTYAVCVGSNGRGQVIIFISSDGSVKAMADSGKAAAINGIVTF